LLRSEFVQLRNLIPTSEQPGVASAPTQERGSPRPLSPLSLQTRIFSCPGHAQVCITGLRHPSNLTVPPARWASGKKSDQEAKRARLIPFIGCPAAIGVYPHSSLLSVRGNRGKCHLISKCRCARSNCKDVLERYRPLNPTVLPRFQSSAPPRPVRR